MATKSTQDEGKKPEAGKAEEVPRGARQTSDLGPETELGEDAEYREERRLRRRESGAVERTDEIDGLVTAAAIGGVAIALESELLPGILIGVGAVLLGRMFPEIGGLVRPAIKSVVRAGYAVTEMARESVAEVGEQFRDIVAEVEEERPTPRRREGQQVH